jgi:hypothetical protein
MNSSSGAEALFTAIVWVGVLILIFRAGAKTNRRRVRILAFVIGIVLTCMILWNTVVVLRFLEF